MIPFIEVMKQGSTARMYFSQLLKLEMTTLCTFKPSYRDAVSFSRKLYNWKKRSLSRTDPGRGFRTQTGYCRSSHMKKGTLAITHQQSS